MTIKQPNDKNRTTQQCSITLPKDQYGRIVFLATRQHRPVSNMLMVAVDYYLQHAPEATQP